MSPAFEETVSELGDSASPLLNTRLAELNDLSSGDLDVLRRSWGSIDVKRRREIVSRLVELAADNLELSFDGVFKHCLKDTDPVVLEKAIEGLWENEESPLISPLIALLGASYPPAVQAAAAAALGKFTLLAEHGKLDSTYSSKITENLLHVFGDRDRTSEVRRRALESLAPMCAPRVTDAIKEAYRSGDSRLVISAVYSMGKSCDPIWLPALLEEMASDDAERRYEAAVAGGELEEKEAVPKLSMLVNDPDIDVSLAAIQSLGRIGGSEAKMRLEQCLASPKDAVRQAARDALEELGTKDEPLSITHRVIEHGYDYRQ